MELDGARVHRRSAVPKEEVELIAGVPVVQLDDERRRIRRVAPERRAAAPEPKRREHVEQRAVVRAIQVQLAAAPVLRVVLLPASSLLSTNVRVRARCVRARARLRVGAREVVDTVEQVAQEGAGAETLHLVAPGHLDIVPSGERVQSLHN